jgi:hypothetical protein
VKAGLAVALSEIICGEPGASSVMVKFAVRWPGPMGVKTSEIVQLAAGTTGAVQLLVKLKSEGFGPPRATDETWRGAVPELMRVSVCTAPDVPCVIVGNEGAAGEKVTPGPAATPVPFRARVCGLPGASSAIVTVAERTPEARGVNVTIIVQAELTAMAELHVGLEEL